MSKILGICGQLGSGKDTAASYLKHNNGFKHLAFAWHIKEFAQQVFGFSEEQLWGPSEKRNETTNLNTTDAEELLWRHGPKFAARVLPQRPHPYHSLYDWFKEYTAEYPTEHSARICLQRLGTEWGRAQDSEIWLKATLSEALTYERVVISDVRFFNEVEFIQKHGGKVIKVIRPETDKLAASIGIAGHKSEAEQKSMPDDIFDAIIVNDRSLEEFTSAIETHTGILFL